MGRKEEAHGSSSAWALSGAVTQGTREEAAEIWRGVASGLWTLADLIDTGGRRFVVARLAPAPAATERLTRRQHEILSCASRGWSNKTISHYFGLSASTVSTHVAEAARRLGVDCRVRAIQAFRRRAAGWENAGER